MRTHLLGVEARWAESRNWTVEHHGDDTEAAFWLDHALHLAHEDHDEQMVVYARMRQAQQAAKTPGLSTRDRAPCAVRQAQGHALGGDGRACATAMRTADALTAPSRSPWI